MLYGSSVCVALILDALSLCMVSLLSSLCFTTIKYRTKLLGQRKRTKLIIIINFHFLQHSLLEYNDLISCMYFVTFYNDFK